MNEERPIEKLLHRYAEKRRDNAGAPPAMHPATRRMLQGEVARRHSRRGKSRKSEPTTFAEVLKLWRRQLIWAIPVLIVVVVGAWVMIGLNEKPGHEFELAGGSPAPTATPEAVENPFEALETPAATAPPTPARRPVATRSQMATAGSAAPSERRLPGEVSAATSQKEPETRTESGRGAASEFAPPLSAEQFHSQTLAMKEKSAEVLPTIGDDKRLAGGLFSSPPAKDDSVDNFESVRQNFLAADANRLAPAPASEPVVGSAINESAAFYRREALNRDDRDKGQVYSQAFMNRAPISTSVAKAKSGGITPVLANFQVEQYGNQLRVIDADGSTYLGEMELPETGKPIVVTVQKKPAGGWGFKKAETTAKPERAAAAAPNSAGMQNYFACQVAGTNRTLNQQVVFAWNFIELTNSPSVAEVKSRAVSANVLQNNLPAQQFPSVLNNSIINGRAQLGSSKEIEVNAVPVTQ